MREQSVQLEGENIPQRGGNTFHGERTERKRKGERAAHWVCTRKTLPQSHLLENREELTIVSFYKPWSSNSEVLEACAICWSQAWWAVVLLERGRVEAQEWTVDSVG